MPLRSIINGKATTSPLARILTTLWLFIVWGTVLVTGCSEDGVFDPTMSSTAAERDALVPGPAGSFQFDPADVLEVNLEQYRGERSGVEAGGDVVGRIKHKSAHKTAKVGKAFKLDLKPVKIEGGRQSVAAEVTLEGNSWVKSTGEGSAATVDWIQFDFIPLVEFLEPLTIEIDTKKVADLADDQGRFQLWVIDAEGSSWSELDYGDDDGKHVTFEIEQSGRYAIIGTDANMRAVVDLDFADPDECEIIHWSKIQECKAGEDEVLKIDKELRLVVHSGSLSADETISADVWIKFIGHGGHATAKWIIVDLEPEMVFLEPVKLQVKEKLVEDNISDDGQYVLWYLDESLSQWVHEDDGSIVQIEVEWNPIQTVIKDFVQFEIEHFSKYAIGR